MASRSSFRATLEYSSDLIHDFCCLSCSEDNKNSEAQHYCQDCSQCYCDVCLQLHNKLHKRHAVLGRKDIDKWSAATVLTGPLVRCEKHAGKILELECVDHRQLCCHVCVSIDHKLCSPAKHVPEVAKGFHDTREFKELPAKVTEIKNCLKNARQSLTDSKNAVEQSGDDCLQQIKSLRLWLNAIIDRLEQHTISEIENGKSSVGVKIQADVDKIDDVMDKLHKLSDDLNDGGEKNEATSYVGFTKCDDMIWNAKVLLQDIKNNNSYKMSFEPYKGIIEYLSSLEMLGEVICDGGEKLLPGADHVFEVEKHVLHNVKVAADHGLCNITGMCKLATGEFLLADNYNLKIKLIDSSYKVTSTCDVPEYPIDVCSIGEREAAVLVNKNSEDIHEIHFFCVRSGRLLKTRTIKLQHRCTSVTHYDGSLYITTDTALHVYNISSGHGRQLYRDDTGKYTVQRCAVSPDGSQIFITNYDDHQLITLNKDGTKLFTLTHSELQYPVGVHITSLGHVFVCCRDFNSVVQVVVEKDGKQSVKPLAGGKEMLNEPIAVCFNSSTDTLLVGLNENDNLVQLQMKH